MNDHVHAVAEMRDVLVPAIERRMFALEQRVATGTADQFALRSELDELKERVAEINARISHIEQQLSRS